MSMRTMLMLGGLLASVGCSSNPPPSMAPQSADRQSLIVTTAEVEQINLTTRQVSLRVPDGREFSVVAGPEIRNLDQVAVGDTVQLAYFESVAASMAEADATEPATTSVVTSRSAKDNKPAGEISATTNMVVEFVAFDPATDVVTYTTAEGQTARVRINPAMREFAAARQAGEKIAIQIKQAVAASIVEAGG
jgi:hypothetical protein